MLIARFESVTARRAVIIADLAITNSCHELNFTADSGKMSIVEGKMSIVEGRVSAVAGMSAIALARQ